MAEAVIPDAGVYGAETAAATNAYNNAVAQATAQRNSLYNQYGLNNQGSVDPNNPNGQYQQMLGAQADQFQGDSEDAAGRGLRGGLAHQAEGHDRRSALAQDYQFQNQVDQVSQDYNQQMQDFLDQKQSSISQAQQDALQTALQNQLDALSAGNYTAPGVGTPADASKPEKPIKGHTRHPGHPGNRHPGRRGRRSGGGGHAYTN